MDPNLSNQPPVDKTKARKIPETAKDVAALFKGEKVRVFKAKQDGPAEIAEVDLGATDILSFRIDAEAGLVRVVTIDGRKLEARL